MNGQTCTMVSSAGLSESGPRSHRSYSLPDLTLTKHHEQHISSFDIDFELEISKLPEGFEFTFKPEPEPEPEPDIEETPPPSSPPKSPQFNIHEFQFEATEFEAILPFETKLPKVEVTHEQPRPKLMALPKAANTNGNRSRSFVNRPRSWLPSSKSATNVRDTVLNDIMRTSENVNEKDTGRPDETMAPEPRPVAARERSASFAEFAKKSWISNSRSPSPKRDLKKPRANGEGGAEDGEPPVDSSLLMPNKLSRRRLTASSLGGLKEEDRSRSSDTLGSTSRALNRASVYFGKIKPQKSQGVQIKGNVSSPSLPASSRANNDIGSSAVSSTLDPTTANTDNFNPRLSTQTGASSSTSDTSSGATGSTGITEPTPQATPDTMLHPAARDPLWAAFRRLDSEYAFFLTKQTTAQRMLVIRQTLVPFLRNYAQHPSNNDLKVLSCEDIDRRATILNKWWNGLLELLDGSGIRTASGTNMSFASSSNTTTAPATKTNLQPVAGVDRPGLLETITYIMMRPEWRLGTPHFRPLKDRSPNEVVRARAYSKNSLDNAAFLAESAEHNVRTMFVNNLLTQMAIVVEKMSSRHAPISLVTFCGKACAYTFFFVPGIAEVLVRLWGLTPDHLRRIADEFGLPRRSKGESDSIVALFPPNLHRLGWSSVKSMIDNLRLTTKLSLVAAKIQWHGPWVSRWRGADTDLFFIFCKYYYILAEEFMPMDLPLVEKARAPAFVLIHAQLLSVLDSTIHHRQAAFDAMMAPSVLDASNGPDAIAASIAQLPPSNLLKGMEENRLVVLLKDILAENSIGGVAIGARHTFATAFMSILKAATKKTHVFRQGPVFMLVDFMQEVLLAFDAYAGYTDPEVRARQEGSETPLDHVDWNFWFDVLQKILGESHNTMSEIRVLSFMFSTWDILTAEPARKEALCLGWLLKEEIFDKFFNNYTPMVRAYFMRLLCWRVCRDRGSPNELDTRIFVLVSERLKQVWSHYLWLKHSAEIAGKLPPSSAPSFPQPGRRFMIIRTAMTTPQNGLLQMGFDSFSSAFGPSHETGVDYRGSLSGAVDSNGDPLASGHGDTAVYKKKWSIVGKMLSFASTTGPGGSAAANGAAKRAADDLDTARRATAAERSGPPPPPKTTSSINNPSSPADSDASSTGSSPVYDAAQFVFKFTLGSISWNQAQDMNISGLLSALPRDRPLTRPRLPAPAQARVNSRAASNGRRSGSPPPRAPGLPSPERMYSIRPQMGLVSEARNAPSSMGELEPVERHISDTGNTPSFLPPDRRLTNNGYGADGQSAGESTHLEMCRARELERQIIQPVQPIGIFKERATYSGRALAEWSIVVNECNTFVDRRRGEGVCGLNEVEIPQLGVENLRRIG